MIDRVAAWMRAAEHVVVLTGAGISAESGVPVFRGAGGLWREYRPEDLATPQAFARQPALVWQWYLWRRGRIAEAQPNAGHHVIARLQRARSGVTLLTQNVDGLHARAAAVALAKVGSPRAIDRGRTRDGAEPIELHGNLWRVRCVTGCGFAARDEETAAARDHLRCACGAWLRPDVVWFGESLDATMLDRATRAVEEADVVLV